MSIIVRLIATIVAVFLFIMANAVPAMIVAILYYLWIYAELS